MKIAAIVLTLLTMNWPPHKQPQDRYQLV